jgi:hypothetical protein
LGFKPGYKPEIGFETKAEHITDHLIIQREIQKAVSGKSYKVYEYSEETESRKSETLPGIPYEIFIYYFKLWNNYSFFGYPQGLNWLEAPQWFNDLIIDFQNAHVKVQNMIDEYNARNSK